MCGTLVPVCTHAVVQFKMQGKTIWIDHTSIYKVLKANPDFKVHRIYMHAMFLVSNRST